MHAAVAAGDARGCAGGGERPAQEAARERVTDGAVDLADQSQPHVEAVDAARSSPTSATRTSGSAADSASTATMTAASKSRVSARPALAATSLPPLLLGEELELGLVLGQAGDQLDHDADAELAPRRHLDRAAVVSLLAGDVDLRGTATTGVLAAARDGEARLGEDVEVVARHVRVQPEHLGHLTRRVRLPLGPQPPVDAGAGRDRQGTRHHVVGVLGGGHRGHGGRGHGAGLLVGRAHGCSHGCERGWWPRRCPTGRSGQCKPCELPRDTTPRAVTAPR